MNVFVMLLAACQIKPLYSIRPVASPYAEAVYSVGNHDFAIESGGGDVTVFSANGDAKRGFKLPDNQSVLGFEPDGRMIYGDGIYPNLWTVDPEGYGGQIRKGGPFWSLTYDNDYFLQTNGRIFIVQGPSNYATLPGIDWRDLYCISPDKRSLFVISGRNFPRVKGIGYDGSGLESIQAIDTDKPRGSMPQTIYTSGHKRAHIVAPWSSSVAALSPTRLVAFCRVGDFGEKERSGTPLFAVGDGNEEGKGKETAGICLIDVPTKTARLVIRFLDRRQSSEDAEFSPGMERRRDFARVGKDGSFVAIYGDRALLCTPLLR